MSVLYKKSRVHCSRSVAMRAHVRLSPRLMNQSALQASDEVGGVKCVGLGSGIRKCLPFAAAASCCEICANSCVVESPESGVRVL
jgi:hypothetical protein